jgi:hypothetical protein
MCPSEEKCLLQTLVSRHNFASKEKQTENNFEKTIDSRSEIPLQPGVWGKWRKMLHSGHFLTLNLISPNTIFLVLNSCVSCKDQRCRKHF